MRYVSGSVTSDATRARAACGGWAPSGAKRSPPTRPPPGLPAGRPAPNLPNRPPGIAPRRVEALAEHVELARFRGAEEARERPRPAEVAGETGAQERGREDRRGRRVAQVRRARHREPGAGAGAVDGRDRHLRHLAQELGDPHVAPEARDVGV